MTVLYSVATGSTILAADINQYKSMLEGGTGYTSSYLMVSTTGTNFIVRLGDAAGSNKLSVQNSSGSEVWAVNSSGTITAGALSPTSLILPISASPAQTTSGSVVWDSTNKLLTVGNGTSRETILPVGTRTVKSANETVNASATLQNDDSFVFTVDANTDYLIEAKLRLATGVTPDWKFAWTLTGMTWDGMYPVTITLETTTTIHVAEAITSGTAKTVTAGGAWASALWVATFIIHSGTTGGTLNFQWAQSTSDASDTKVLKSSIMTMQRLGAT